MDFVAMSNLKNRINIEIVKTLNQLLRKLLKK